jgi:hypothetical protein
LQQLRFVNVVRHLPLPKQRPCFRNVACDNAKGEAVARTAAIEAESEPGLSVVPRLRIERIQSERW